MTSLETKKPPTRQSYVDYKFRTAEISWLGREASYSVKSRKSVMTKYSIKYCTITKYINAYKNGIAIRGFCKQKCESFITDVDTIKYIKSKQNDIIYYNNELLSDPINNKIHARNIKKNILRVIEGHPDWSTKGPTRKHEIKVSIFNIFIKFLQEDGSDSGDDVDDDNDDDEDQDDVADDNDDIETKSVEASMVLETINDSNAVNDTEDDGDTMDNEGVDVRELYNNVIINLNSEFHLEGVTVQGKVKKLIDEKLRDICKFPTRA